MTPRDIPTAIADITHSLPAVMTVDETARTMRLSRRTIERWISDGRISTLPGCERPRIARVEVLRLLFGREAA